MILPFDVLWFVILVLLMAVFSTAFLMNAHIFWALILLFIVLGIALSLVSMVSKRKTATHDSNEENVLLEYLKSHGLGGNLLEIAQNLGLDKEKISKLLMSLEQHGAIPAGSSKAFSINQSDVNETSL